MLQITQLSRRYGQTLVVNNLNLEVEKGQIRGLLGPNGAGKSTTIRMICGVLTPSGGEIRIDGRLLSHRSHTVRSILGYVPEGAPLPVDLQPQEYLKYVASMYGLSGSARTSAIAKWSDRTAITDVLRKPISTLSRGYRQRVALTGALVHKPKLLVLDEPSTGLDPAQSASFRKLIRDVSDSAAILYSSHHLAEVEATCDVVSIISNGKVILDSSFHALQHENASIEAEVSPHSIASELGGDSIEIIDDEWCRCIIKVGDDSYRQAGEGISQRVQSAGGKLRLLQPTSQTLESTYLRLIREAEVSS